MDVRHQTALSAVLIPGLQAVVSGALVGLCVWSLAALAGRDRPHLLGLALATTTAAVSWGHLLQRWLRALEIGLGVEEQPIVAAEPESVRVIVTNEERTQGVIGDLPASERQLVRLGAGVMDGKPLAESYWTGSHGPFSVRQFRLLRDTMIDRGWLAWRNETARSQGVRVTPQGKAVLKYYALEFSPAGELRDRKNGARLE